MEAKEFLENTIGKMDEQFYVALKEKLIGEYINFSFFDENHITRDVLAEKLWDYFEKVDIENNDKFENTLQKYLDNWDIIVSRCIATERSAKSEEAAPQESRAKKYLNKLQEIKKTRSITNKQILDFSRIAMCLYAAIVNANHEDIEDFDFSIKCLNLDEIISAMKSEETTIVFVKKNTFDLDNIFSYDTSTFIITMIMYYQVKNGEYEGEY